jgi:hypothetical protein
MQEKACSMQLQCCYPTVIHQRPFCLLQAVHQSSAVLGLGLIGMAEDLGNAMAHRALEHLLQYGDTAVRSSTDCCDCPVYASSGFALCGTSSALQRLRNVKMHCSIALGHVVWHQSRCRFHPAKSPCIQASHSHQWLLPYGLPD